MPAMKTPPPLDMPPLVSRLKLMTAPFRDPHGLFSGGPPHWTVSRGKKYERPCQTLVQANRQRKVTTKRLHRHGNRNGNMASLNLEAKLLACTPARPCLSGACPICMRAQQRLLVIASIHILPQLARPAGDAPKAISLVPDFGRVELGALAGFDVAKFRRDTRATLRASGVNRFLLGLDVSLNHEDGKRDDAHWQLQWWGLFEEPSGSWRKRLKALANKTRAIRRPVKAITPDSLEAAAAYGLKSTFKRRVSCVKANLDRDDRGACRNTNDRLLRGDASVELMLFLDRMSLENRLLGHGLTIPYQPLRSRKLSEPGGSQ
jgi:hypothetical protein